MNATTRQRDSACATLDCTRFGPFHMKAVVALCVLLAGCAGAPPRVLLLGEVHDNPDGHRQRFDRLRALVDGGWRPAIAMEQFDREKQAALTSAQATCPDADCVIAAAGGGKSWNWAHYRPVIALAMQYRLPLLAGNLSRADAGLVMKGGFGAAFDAPTMAAFGLLQPLPPQLFDAQVAVIMASHCGQLPASMAPGMARAQVARDVWMAKVVVAHADGVVLLAGNGHVRRDIGVAQWLGGLAASSEGYLEPGTVGTARYDVVHAIAPHARVDPCKAMGAIKPR